MKDTGLTLHNACVVPDHEDTAVMKGSPPPLPSPDAGEGDQERLRRVFTLPFRTARVAALATLALVATAPSAAVLYDAGLGSLPSDQGWTYGALGSASQSVEGGLYVLDTTGASSTQAGSFQVLSPGILDTGSSFDLGIRLQVLAEDHASGDRAGFSLLMVGDDPTDAIELAFWTDQVWTYRYDSMDGFRKSAGEASLDTTSVPRDYLLKVRAGAYTLEADEIVLFGGQLQDYTPAATFGPTMVYAMPNLLFFGDDTTSAGARVAITSLTLTAVPLPGAALLLAPALAVLGLTARPRARRPIARR
jgi:hypothetical protein